MTSDEQCAVETVLAWRDLRAAPARQQVAGLIAWVDRRIRKYVRTAHWSEDLRQRSLERVLGKVHDLRSEEPNQVLGWLDQIIRNGIPEQRRQAARSGLVHVPKSARGVIESSPPPEAMGHGPLSDQQEPTLFDEGYIARNLRLMQQGLEGLLERSLRQTAGRPSDHTRIRADLSMAFEQVFLQTPGEFVDARERNSHDKRQQRLRDRLFEQLGRERPRGAADEQFRQTERWLKQMAVNALSRQKGARRGLPGTESPRNEKESEP